MKDTKSTKEKSLGVRLEEKMYDALEAIARRDDRSLGYVVRAAITEYIKKELGR